MRVGDGIMRYTVETLLVAAALTLTVYVWLIDPVANQRAFGVLVGSAFVIFSMMIYAYNKPSLTGSGNTWLIAGCVAESILLLLAVQLTG